MVELTTEQRATLMDKLPDFANLGVGALVFGQWLGEGPRSLTLVAVGLSIWAALGGLTLYLGRRQ